MLETNTESQRYHRLFRVAAEEILGFYEANSNQIVQGGLKFSARAEGETSKEATETCAAGGARTEGG